MDNLAFASLLMFFSSLANAAFVFLSPPRNFLKFMWGVVCLVCAAIGIHLYGLFTATDKTTAYVHSLTLNIDAIFIPIFFFHFTLLLTNRLDSKRNELRLYYLITFLYIAAVLKSPRDFVPDVQTVGNIKYYCDSGHLFYFLPVLLIYLMGYGLILVYRSYRNALPLKRNQLKFFFFGCLLGLIGSISSFLPAIGVPVYPWGIYLIPLCLLIVAFAVVKHQLMDIQVIFRLLYKGGEPGQTQPAIQPLKDELLTLERCRSYREIAASVAAALQGPLARLKAKTQTVEDIETLEELCRQLEDGSQPLPQNFEAVDAVQVLDELLNQLLVDLKGQKITIFKYYQASETAKILGNSRQLRQALFYIFDHCLQVLKNDHGDIFVTIEHDAKWVSFSIRHSGRGLSDEEIQRIFEPFFKSRLFRCGLSMIFTQTVVLQHGGKIRIESDKDSGTEFLVDLPLI